MQGVYKIVHIPTGKHYTGSSVNVKNRLMRHKADLRGNRHHCASLQDLWNNWAESDFAFNFAEDITDPGRLIEREQVHIDDAVKAGLCMNTCLCAKDCSGLVKSEESRRKLSRSLTGRIVSEEARRNISNAKKGKGISEATREGLRKLAEKQTFKMTHEEAMQAWKTHCDGVSIEAVAMQLGISTKPLRRELKRHLGPDYKPVRRLYCEPKKGGSHQMALLTEQDVLEIRSSGQTIKALAVQYGVSYACIWDIVNCRSWTHLV